MKIFKLTLAISALTLILTGCSLFSGRPEQDNINQVRGSNVWMDTRLNEEQTGRELEGQFEDQEDQNSELPLAIETDRSFP